MLNTKKELKKLVVKQSGFMKDNPIFVNQRLCKHYRVLWSVTKRFYSLKIQFQEAFLCCIFNLRIVFNYFFHFLSALHF